MSHRRFHRSILWLMPWLVLRAFVPAGFMVSTGLDGPQLSLCSGHTSLPGAPAAELDPHAAHHGAHHGQRADVGDVEHAAGHGGKHFDAPCPFGIAAVGITVSVLRPAPVSVLPTDESFTSSSARVVAAGPLRSDYIRGPPLQLS